MRRIDVGSLVRVGRGCKDRRFATAGRPRAERGWTATKQARFATSRGRAERGGGGCAHGLWSGSTNSVAVVSVAEKVSRNSIFDAEARRKNERCAEGFVQTFLCVPLILKTGLEKQEQAEEAEAEGILTIRGFARTVNPKAIHFRTQVRHPPLPWLPPVHSHRRFQAHFFSAPLRLNPSFRTLSEFQVPSSAPRPHSALRRAELGTWNSELGTQNFEIGCTVC